MSFEDFALAQPIARAVAGEGYAIPTPLQCEAIPHVLAGRDLLGCAQTGTGKTAAFALPILHRLISAQQNGVKQHDTQKHPRRIRVLVLAPTRELAVQIGESFAAYGRHTGLRQTVLLGGVSQHHQVRALQKGVDVLVATPGRLVDLIGQGFVHLGVVETFVVDEADRLLDMGFLPDLRRVIAKLPPRRQTLMFSATMPAEIEKLARSILREPVRIEIAPVKATTELIEQSVCFVPKQQKPHLLAELLVSKAMTRALVFTRTKRGADRVAQHLNRSGIRAEAMHGNKSQSARQRSLTSFKSNRPPVLVATDLAARGIDVEGISHVVNYDLPYEAETYIHRIGRTGRAGVAGVAIALCDHDERTYLKAIERLIRRTLRVDKDHSTSVPAADSGAGQRSPAANEQGGQQRSRQQHSGQQRSGQQRSGQQRPGHAKNRRPPSTGGPAGNYNRRRSAKRKRSAAAAAQA